MSDTSARFTTLLAEALALVEKDVIAALRTLIGHPYPKEVVEIDFELFSDSWSEGFPARAFFMDENNCEHFVISEGNAKYPSPIDPRIIDVPAILSRDLETQLHRDDPELDTSALGAQVFIPWFLRCWQRAGGNAFGLRATIAEHDAQRELNLQTGLWQER